jgi:broad specificity phosphatase PhoE
VETWQEFCLRVNRGLKSFLADGGKGEVAAIFTSGGPLSVVVQSALHLSAQDTLRIAWMARNCSFSEFLFSRDRLTLSSFNSFPHLDDDSLLTYR